MDELKHHWDETQTHKQAYTKLVVELSEELSPVQIANFIGVSRQRIQSQLRRAKRR